MSLLAIKNLSVSIHGHPILQDVTLDVAPGEIVAVTGESGSGKSITALCVMQLLPVGADMSGAVLLDGQDLSQISDVRHTRQRRGDDFSRTDDGAEPGADHW